MGDFIFYILKNIHILNYTCMRKIGGSKSTTRTFDHKVWYDVKAPIFFTNCQVGKTPVTRGSVEKSSDALKGHTFEVSLADLQQDELQAFRKIIPRVEKVSGHNCLTNFHGMELTKEKIGSLVKKRQTLIEFNKELTLIDGFKLRIFIIAFTQNNRKRPNSTEKKKACYAKSSQIHEIRKLMENIVEKETKNCTIKDLIHKLILEVIGKKIEKRCFWICPLKNCMIRKIKVLKAPKYDSSKFPDTYENEVVEDIGHVIERSTIA